MSDRPVRPSWWPTGLGTIIAVIVLIVCVVLLLPIPMEGKPSPFVLGLIAALAVSILT